MTHHKQSSQNSQSSHALTVSITISTYNAVWLGASIAFRSLKKKKKNIKVNFKTNNRPRCNNYHVCPSQLCLILLVWIILVPIFTSQSLLTTNFWVISSKNNYSWVKNKTTPHIYLLLTKSLAYGFNGYKN